MWGVTERPPWELALTYGNSQEVRLATCQIGIESNFSWLKLAHQDNDVFFGIGGRCSKLPGVRHSAAEYGGKLLR